MTSGTGCRRGAAIVAFTLVSVATGCSKGGETVATLRTSPSEIRLPFPGFEPVRIELTPTRELPPDAELQIFLHLLDEPGSVLRTFDLPVPGGWTPGRTKEIEARLYQSALADPLESGTYLLTAGLYDRNSGRFGLDTEAVEVARLEYQIGTVSVPPPGAELPGVRFSEGWLPAVPGQDRQVLSRRGLDGKGPSTFQIGPLSPPGQLLLRLAPALVVVGRIELDGEESTAKVRLRSSCGGFEAELSGDAASEALIDVPAAAGAVSCDVELAPNFVVRSPDDGKLRSIAIEVLAWRSGAPAG
jgi:hypothetical protein